MKTIIVVAAVALVFTIVLVCLGVAVSNREGRENGSSDKSYNLWSILSGLVIGFFVILYELLMDLFVRRRRRY